MACLNVVAARDAKVRAKDDLTRALDALAVAEEDGHRLEAGVAHLVVEQTSLLLKLETSKYEVSSLHSQTSKDKEAMEEDYQKALKLIFAYGYGCCAFKHSICGDQPGIPDGMPDSTDPLPPEFFCNPSPLVEVKAVEVDLGEVAKDPEEDVVAKE